jgi:lactate permease
MFDWRRTVYQQNFNPTGSLWLSALFAALPLVTVLVLLGVFKWRAHWAGLSGLLASLLVAVFVYKMDVSPALNSAFFGAARSVYIVLWITFNAIWIYNMTVHTGHFAVLRRSFSAIGEDQRVQALVIAFSFGALIEALAGGGSPVAIAAVMLVAIGFHPLKAAALALVANTAPVAFGGMGNPITVLGTTTGLAPEPFGAMAGRQSAFVALLVPFALLLIADGKRGLKQVWPAALVTGASFAVTQIVVSQYVYKLTDIIAALVSAGVLVLFTRVWKPSEDILPAPLPVPVAGGSVDDPSFVSRVGRDTKGEILKAFSPYLIIIALFSIAQILVSTHKVAGKDTAFFPAIKNFLAPPGTLGSPGAHWQVNWADFGLHVNSPAAKPVAAIWDFQFLYSPGSLLFFSGLLTVLVLRISITRAAKIYWQTLRQFGWAILTVLAVFALALVMQLSGQIVTLGQFLAKAGVLFAFLAPIVGWFGVAITGTDAGSNALMGGLQQSAATSLHESPVLFGAANSTGGVAAKMISPQNLAIGTAAVGEVGQEGSLFRSVIGWSVAMVLLMGVIVWLQSTALLGWMVP